MLAKEFLARHGIHLVCLEHLPRTHLDGAAFQLADGTPVIGLTDNDDNIADLIERDVSRIVAALVRRVHKPIAYFDAEHSAGTLTSLISENAPKGCRNDLCPCDAFACDPLSFVRQFL
jgi:hypothetical protein